MDWSLITLFFLVMIVLVGTTVASTVVTGLFLRGSSRGARRKHSF